MIKTHRLKVIFIFYISLSALYINAQKVSSVTTLQEIITSVDTFNLRLPAEKLYVHFDKTNYAIGDTVWFKAYLLQRSTHAYSPLSGVLYVELISDSNSVVKRMSFPAAFGLSWGQIPLQQEEVKEGNYTIRVYTNWMQNFGDDYFYHQPISVSAPLTTAWLIKEDHIVVASADKNNIDFALRLNNIDNTPAGLKDVDLKILRGRKVLYRRELKTTPDGIVKGTFTLPINAETKDISIVVNDKADPARKSIVPLFFNQEGNIDVQFMPESGHMVSGITSRIGFKAIGEKGFGIKIEGKIVDGKNVDVASFRSIYRGMGIFEFTPAKNESYTAVVTLPGGNTKRFPLPALKTSGIVLQFDNEQNSDSIRLKINISPDLINNKTYHLIGLSRGVVCYGANIIMRNTEIKAKVAKSLFPSGVAHFTLMNSAGQPVNERILFIDHSDNLIIDVQSFKNNFSARDSIPLHIKVTDKQGKPVTGSFSIAVTDDAQVRADSVFSENIVTRMLLSAEVKGNIEAPDYYITNTGPQAWQALDALLLTQGWKGYNWAKIMKPTVPLFAAEPIFSVRGRVTNMINKPISKARITLMSPGPRLNVRDTTTNMNGEFIFTSFKKPDSLSFLIDARNAKDKKFGINLIVHQFKPAELQPLSFFTALPWYVNSDSTIVNYALNKQRIEEELYESGAYKKLQEVKISVRKVVPGSSNLNGAGQADQILDEADIQKEAGKGKTLLQLLQEKVRGLITLAGDSNMYKVKGYHTLYIIDGISLRNFGPARETLEYLEVEDIKGIEVMYSQGNISRYESAFLTLAEQMSTSERKYIFIEITTRSGNGVFFKKSPGLMIYKPVPNTLPVQFYSPKYRVKNNSDKIKDLRSTVYWQPALVTNTSGEAGTYFYAADTPTTYTIIIQGSNINGSVGHKVEKISINR